MKVAPTSGVRSSKNPLAQHLWWRQAKTLTWTYLILGMGCERTAHWKFLGKLMLAALAQKRLNSQTTFIILTASHQSRPRPPQLPSSQNMNWRNFNTYSAPNNSPQWKSLLTLNLLTFFQHPAPPPPHPRNHRRLRRRRSAAFYEDRKGTGERPELVKRRLKFQSDSSM